MNTVGFVRIVALLSTVALLSACALGGGGERYRLIAPNLTVETGANPIEGLTLAVARPLADRSRDSSHILVRRGRDLMPWPAAAWIDRAPELVRGLLIDAFDGHLATVVRRGTVSADYRLELDLRRFELVEGPDGLAAELLMSVRLLDKHGQLLATARFHEADHPARGGSLDAGVAALEQAMAQSFSSLADWLRSELPRAL